MLKINPKIYPTRITAILISLFILMSGCTNNKPHDNTADTTNPATESVVDTTSSDDKIDYAALNEKYKYKSVEPVGQVPDEFKNIVENNLFAGITAFEYRLFKREICSGDEENRTKVQQVKMMDLFGKELATYKFTSEAAYNIRTLTATKDGGFLFVLGFVDFAYNKDEWASDKGFASRVIKCDKSGKIEFDTAFNDVEGTALGYCFEKDEKFYFFGTRETPETKTRGVHSATDIYMAVVDKDGEILQTKVIAGNDFDSLNEAELIDDVFTLSIHSWSHDRDFSDVKHDGEIYDYIFRLDDNLEIIDKEKEDSYHYYDLKIGEKDGNPVCQRDTMFTDFDAGAPMSYINYGDFYLIVSDNITGIYENTPLYLCDYWYNTETVYSAYDNNDQLLFRATVDSTPDYEEWLKE